jgi:hypothetical protein
MLAHLDNKKKQHLLNFTGMFCPKKNAIIK